MTTMSMEAYAKIVDKLPSRRGSVFALFRMGENCSPRTNLTIRNICDALRWPINVVSPRVFELSEAGLIKPNGESRDGQTVWVASAPDEVEALRAARKAAKRYETGVVSFQGVGGPEAFGPDQMISVHVQIPRKIWATIKSPVKVRFL